MSEGFPQSDSSDHSLIIAIHAGLYELKGMTNGWVARMDAIENRQAEVERRFEARLNEHERENRATQEKTDKRLDDTWAKINQAIGFGKTMGGLVVFFTVIATAIQLYLALSK